MSIVKSEEAFTTRFNCAQSIYKGFQEKHNIAEDVIAQARVLGGGRAAGGTCGALYAALQLIKDEKQKEKLINYFTSFTQSTKCREIRRNNTASCKECVNIAARFLEENL